MGVYISDENGKLTKYAGVEGKSEIDASLSWTSENPVQNKVLYNPVTFAETERQKSKNLYNKNAITRGKALSSVDGSIADNYNYFVSNYMIVNGLSQVVVSGRGSYGYFCFYTKDKTPIMPVIVEHTNNLTVPSNAYYLVFEEQLTYANNDIQVESGSVATDYVSYYGEISRKGDKEIQFARSEYEKSKNLLHLINCSANHSGLSVVYNEEEQTVTLNGTTNKDSDWLTGKQNILPWIKNFSGKNLTLSANVISGSATGTVQFALCFKDSPWYEGWVNTALNLGSTQSKASKLMTIKTNQVFNLLRVFVVGGVTFNNLVVKLQVEENSIATDWKYPYGVIVHEEDVEHVEVIYNKDTKNIINGTAYTNGIQGSNTFYTSDFSKYKKVIFYAICDENCTIAEVDLMDGNSTHNGSGTSNGGSMKYPRFMYVYMNNTSSFRVQFAQWIESISNVGESNNNAGFYVYRIEGVY